VLEVDDLGDEPIITLAQRLQVAHDEALLLGELTDRGLDPVETDDDPIEPDDDPIEPDDDLVEACVGLVEACVGSGGLRRGSRGESRGLRRPWRVLSG
jgi:hypothetical protein